jgi:ubiquinone biosynthesis protein Coq4
MDTEAEWPAFVARASWPWTDADLVRIGQLARLGGDGRDTAAAMAYAAFSAPGDIVRVYDACAGGFFGRDVMGPVVAADGHASVPDAGFWTVFEGLARAASQGIGAGDITMRTAGLAALLPADFEARAAAACRRYPGVEQAAAHGFPARFQLADLAAAPLGSLGHELYRLLVDNGYDIEVLDRDTLGLTRLVPPLDYLNARILQSHDLWHIVAGYRTTKLHEIALSTFQLAQFGHNYSAMFLAVVMASAAFFSPAATPLLLETIFTAWAHGRATPPMMPIAWEAVWDWPTAQVRAEYGIATYESPFPADIIEMFEAAA